MARSEVNYIYDAANAFRAPGQAAVDAAGQVGALPLDKLVNVRPSSQRGKLGAEGYKIVVAVSEIAVPAGEEYNFSVKVGATGAASTVVGTVSPAQAGQFVVELDAHTIENLDADREEIVLDLAFADAATGNESIKFAAWLL